MKMTKEQWLSILVPAARAASKKPVRPGEALALVQGNGAHVIAKASDGTIGVEASVEASGEMFRACVDASTILERVKAMPDGVVSVAVDGSALAVSSGTRRFRLPMANEDDFLALDRADGERLDVELGDMLAAMRTVRHAVSTDDTRPHISSMLIEADGGVRAVATDGHRMFLATRGEVGEKPRKLLIPRAAVVALLGLPDDAAGSVHVDKKAARMTVEVEGETSIAWTLRLADAVFPPYAQVMPKDSWHECEVDSSALSSALSAVSLASAERSGGVVLRFGDGTVAVSSQSAERGDGADEVPCIGKTGDGEPIGVNAKYMADALDAVGSDASVQATNQLDPIRVRSKDRATVCVVMPMRV